MARRSNKKNDEQVKRPSEQEAESSSSSQQPKKPPLELNDLSHLSIQEIYQFYVQVLFPAIMSSVPILMHRLFSDTNNLIQSSVSKFFAMVLPNWSSYSSARQQALLPSLKEFWENNVANNPLSESLLYHFDTNQDGHISREEILNMTEFLQNLPPAQDSVGAWFAHLAQEWPLLDWKLGVFLWRSFGGILFVLALLSIVPGCLHGWSARVLRWPVLGLTYFLIWVELVVYTAIRIIIRIAEFIVARPKHRKLRQKMAQSRSYQEWYEQASQLDKSQKRNKWLQSVDDETSYRYNWDFIKELIKDMQQARSKGDSIVALAVIQQCTRLNVGGIMSSDLFSYSNTGEPKAIVKQFMQEVVDTLHWITDEATSVPVVEMVDEKEKKKYQESVQTEFRKEKNRLFQSLVGWIDRSGSSIDSEDVDVDAINLDESTAESTCSSQPKKQQHETPLDDDDKEKSSSARKKSPETASSKPQEEVVKQPLPAVHRDQVVEFLKRARVAYGRTALCLSGGAMMGLYHFGTIKGLAREGILPHIISGTSAGSVIGALVCTRTDTELEELLTPEILSKFMTCFDRPWKDRLKSVWKSGHMFGFDEWMEKIKWFANGNTTFQEAFKRTGRIFCITLSSTSKKAPPVLVNYLSAPNVTIASAVLASAAVPGFIPPVRLQYKDSNGVIRGYGEHDQTYFDGSIRQDIPISGLAEMLNCQFFIASQCNPHIVPFFFNPKGGVGRPSRWSSGNQEHSWRGGFLLAALEMYLKNDMKAKFVFLNQVEAAVGFTSTMMTQEFVGSTTLVPQVAFEDYFKLFSDPSCRDLERCFQGGEVAAYEHAALIKMHYSIADALDDCISKLERNGSPNGQSTYTRRATFETNIHPQPQVVTQSRGLSLNLTKPLEQRVTEAIRVKKGGGGSITFGNLLFDEDEFVPINC